MAKRQCLLNLWRQKQEDVPRAIYWPRGSSEPTFVRKTSARRPAFLWFDWTIPNGEGTNTWQGDKRVNKKKEQLTLTKTMSEFTKRVGVHAEEEGGRKMLVPHSFSVPLPEHQVKSCRDSYIRVGLKMDCLMWNRLIFVCFPARNKRGNEQGENKTYRRNHKLAPHQHE